MDSPQTATTNAAHRLNTARVRPSETNAQRPDLVRQVGNVLERPDNHGSSRVKDGRGLRPEDGATSDVDVVYDHRPKAVRKAALRYVHPLQTAYFEEYRGGGIGGEQYDPILAVP